MFSWWVGLYGQGYGSDMAYNLFALLGAPSCRLLAFFSLLSLPKEATSSERMGRGDALAAIQLLCLGPV